MRFANPPGLASFMAKNAGYDQIGSQGIKESVDTDLTTMGTMGQAQANALNTIAKDKAAEEMRDARAFGMAQQADAQLFGSIAGAVGTIGGSAIKGGAFSGNSGTTPLKGPKLGTYDWNTELDIGGMTPAEILTNPYSAEISYNPFGG